MTETIIKATSGKDGPVSTIKYELATDLTGLAKQFGEGIIYNHARSSIVVALQGAMRTLMKANKTPAEIQKACNEWKPGIRKPAKTKAERIEHDVAAMTPDERKELLARLKAT